MHLVVAGLGYVGLPLALEALRAGFFVTGYDTSHEVVRSLAEERSYVDLISDADVAEARRSGFTATSESTVFAQADVIAICVPTPLRLDGAPDLTMVVDVTKAIAKTLRAGQLVILESTTYPGTTEEVILPLLEATGLTVGKDFNCAYSPERIDPGNKSFTFRETPKIVSGVTPACSSAASEFYGQIVDQIVLARGTREAELAKLLENTYRYVNIALINEFALICHDLDIDVWDVINCASTKPFGFSAFRPGPGVGGHCIPIDPHYLNFQVQAKLGNSVRLVDVAREVNQSMPNYVVDRIQQLFGERGEPCKGSKLLLLGVTYKADVTDQREAPAPAVAQKLLGLGFNVSFHDPYVEQWDFGGPAMTRVETLNEEVLKDFDMVVVLQFHKSYEQLRAWTSSTPVFDTQGQIQGPNAVRL